MILYNIEPTKDVSSVSVQQVVKKLKLKSYHPLHKILKSSMKYIAYHEPRDINEDIKRDRAFGACRYAALDKTRRLLMPLSTAWRLIKDAEAGLILQKAERHE